MQKRSLEAYERAHEISRAAVGDQHHDTVLYLVGKGTALGAVGRAEEAAEVIGLGLAMGHTVLGMRHPVVGSIHHALALEYERRLRAAKARARRRAAGEEE